MQIIFKHKLYPMRNNRNTTNLDYPLLHGFTLVALPFFLFANFSLPEAVAISTIGSTIQRVIVVSRMRGDVDWRELKSMMIIGVIFLPFGIFVLRKISFLNQEAVKQIIGVFIIAVLMIQWLCKIEARDVVKKSWGYLAAAISGLLTGFANIGGPPIILWILAHHWPNERMRVTSLAFTLAFVPFQVVILPIVFGKSILISFLLAIVFSPIVYIGAKLGMKLGMMLPKWHLRISMQGLLILIAIISIVKPLLKG